MFICGFKISTWSVLLLSYFYLIRADDAAVSPSSSAEDKNDPLVAVESKNDKTIIKQINKLNEDGTYTFGYEADDGTFKYESRDVLGNIKGTLGFIDNNGVIKRISYTSTDNSTDSLEEVSEEVTATAPPKSDSYTGTTRRPSSLVYPQISTTKSNVIQSIPKRKTTTPSPSSTESTTFTSASTPKVIFATSASSSTSPPKIIMPPSPHTRPILQNGIFVRSTIPPQNHARIEGQLIRPVQVDSTTTKPVTEGPYVRRVLVSRAPIQDQSKSSSAESQVTSSTSRPGLLDVSKEEKSHRSNTYRRQLNEKHLDFDPQQQILDYQQQAGDDTTDIYGSSVATGTQRPLFTTTQSSRVIPAPANQRATSIRNGHYVPAYRRPHIRNRQDPLAEAPTTQPSTTEEPYQTQTTIPVISIPDYPDERNYIKFRQREYLREGGSQGGPQVEIADPQTTYPSREYIRDNHSPNGPVQFPQQPIYRTRRLRPLPPNVAYNGEYNDQNNYHQAIQPIPIPLPPPGYLRQGIPNPQQDITNNLLTEDIQPPVTNRDFQRLLHQLIFVQNKLQQLAQLAYQQNPYRYQGPRGHPGYQPQEYGPIQFEQPQGRSHRGGYLPNYQDLGPTPQQYEQVQYDPRYVHNNHVRRRVQQLTPYDIQQQQQQDQQEYLPPEIREMLLLRMLQLAIHSEIAATNQMEVITSSPSKVSPVGPTSAQPATAGAVTQASEHHQTRKEHGVRNVKILGEEKERLKPTARNKRYQDPNEDMDYYE